SAIPDRWREQVLRWLQLGERCAGADDQPSRGVQYLLFQTLVGTWPIEHERLQAYLVKALREAKRETSWLDPDEAYERAVLTFAERLLASEEFRAGFEPFVEEVARAGERSALGQLLLKLTCPGVPA